MTEKKYYDGVDFPEMETEAVEAVPVVEDDVMTGMDVTRYMTEVRRMVTAVESGQSTISRGAIQLRNSPTMKAIAQLESTPSMKAFLHFLEMAQQDVNRRFRQECELIFCENEDIKNALEAVRVAEAQAEADALAVQQQRALKDLENRNG